jgi:hypothetical protein
MRSGPERCALDRSCPSRRDAASPRRPSPCLRIRFPPGILYIRTPRLPPGKFATCRFRQPPCKFVIPSPPRVPDRHVRPVTVTWNLPLPRESEPVGSKRGLTNQQKNISIDKQSKHKIDNKAKLFKRVGSSRNDLKAISVATAARCRPGSLCRSVRRGRSGRTGWRMILRRG